MKTIFVFLADGFEDIEALGTVDILRRAGLNVLTVSIMSRETVLSSSRIPVVADALFEEVDCADADMLVLPGGMPGSTNLRDCHSLQDALKEHNAAGKWIAAICAAPMVLGNIGLLNGKKATCYPGCQNTMKGAEYTQELCTIDGNIITGEGPAAVFPFAYTLVDILLGSNASAPFQEGMRYNHLMNV